ncbi:MAG TPA: DUF2254 domain-containing protein [Gemmatimonadota bacterium]|nr:DUF2254 domain-containing protein [Gemmatimonadota bacterium]
MLVRIRAWWEGFRSNLFFIPLIYLIVAAAVAQALLEVDQRITQDRLDLPLIFRSTVDSARAVLSTVATATITVAGISFSISLLLFQLASNQFSPRVLHGFFRDSFTKHVLGLVVGTFTYCLLVLRAVRGAVENGTPIIPNLSVALGLLLGIASILAIVAFINHTAHSMHATEIIARITDETRHQIRRLAQDPEESDGRDPDPEDAPEAPDVAFVVTARADGWVQQVDDRGLLDAADDGGTVRLETYMGDFVPKGAPLCAVWPPPSDRERAAKEAREAVRLGRARTLQQDLGFGIRQLADIALRALSTGINDPTTGSEVLSHLGGVVWDLLVRDLPRNRCADDRGRRLFRPHELSHDHFVELAFGQIRVSAASQPAVVRHLLDVLGPLARMVEEGGYPDRAEMVRRQARLAIEGAAAARILDADMRALEERARHHGIDA